MIYSRQREAIVRTLCEHNHPTADELFALLRRDEPSISLATVYRNLNQLVAAGKVMRIPFPGRPDRFDAVNDGHYHMACECCGQVCDVPRAAVPELCEPAQRVTGLELKSSHVLFFGLCNKCSALGQS